MRSYEAAVAASLGGDCSAYSFWKGRVALEAILRALGLQGGDEVIVPAYTCMVVPNAIRLVGAIPVYADIGAGNYNIDPLDVEKKVTPRTRVLIVQHTYGIPANLEALASFAQKHGLHLVEDCAHVLIGSF